MITENNTNNVPAKGKNNQASTVISRMPVDQILYSETVPVSAGGHDNSKSAGKPFIVGLQLGPNSLPLAITVSPDDDPSVLTIDDIFSPGLVASWNNSHSEAMSVQRGDIIVAVNHFTGNGREMLEMLANIEGISHEEMIMLHIKPGVNRTHAQQKSLNAVLQDASKDPPAMLTEGGNLRAAFTVNGTLWPGNMNLGLALSVDDHPTHLTVDSVHSSGLIAHWNNMHSDAERLRTGDYISSINDKSGAHLEMLNAIDEAQKTSIHRTAQLRIRVEPGCGQSGLGKNGKRKAPIFY